jgi:hypothetical protein
MKYYKAPNNEVFGVDSDQGFLIQPDWRELVGEELEAHLNPPKKPLTQEQVERQRLFAYQQEADPLFFKFQRGEATQQEWLNKIAEIKRRFTVLGA